MDLSLGSIGVMQLLSSEEHPRENNGSNTAAEVSKRVDSQ